MFLQSAAKLTWLVNMLNKPTDKANNNTKAIYCNNEVTNQAQNATFY